MAPSSITCVIFNFPANLPRVGTFNITHVIDDGAIVYLNGQELFRFNMADGDALAADQAIGHVTTPTCVTLSIPATNLLAGDNVLAAEVHQFNSNDGDADVYFGIQMELVYQVTSQLPPKLVSSRDGAANV